MCMSMCIYMVVVIYAIQDYLIEQLSGLMEPEQIITGGWDVNDSQTAIYLKDLGGSTRDWPDKRSDGLIQVVARAKNDFDARKIANYAFSALRELFRITLTFETTEYFINKIGAIQRPTPMGTSETGLYQYVNNYEVIFPEEI